jgi:hypothetical protein
MPRGSAGLGSGSWLPHFSSQIAPDLVAPEVGYGAEVFSF